MAAVVAQHTVTSYPAAVCMEPVPDWFFYLIQPLKFGSIGFFLISGFLFGERMNKQGSLQYFGRRLRNVFLPWTIWFSLFCMMKTGLHLSDGRLATADFARYVTLWRWCLFDTAFWFVPNLLIALAILLAFRKILNDVRVGLVFLAASLFYGANIYGHWIPVMHSRAIFGFVFYLWLGAWWSWHFDALERILRRISKTVIVSLILFALALALGESKLLFALGSIDPMNTLRISNQVYSVIVVLAIVRLRHAAWPRFVDVRGQTFGLYLTHTVGIAVAHAGFVRGEKHFPAASQWARGWGGALVLPALYLLIYFGCLALVQLLQRSPRTRWTVGLPARKRVPKFDTAPSRELASASR